MVVCACYLASPTAGSGRLGYGKAKSLFFTANNCPTLLIERPTFLNKRPGFLNEAFLDPDLWLKKSVLTRGQGKLHPEEGG